MTQEQGNKTRAQIKAEIQAKRDLIVRTNEETIEAFQRGLEEMFGLDNLSIAFFQDFKRLYLQLPKEEEKWISVEDGFPKKGERVNVFTDMGVYACCYINLYNEWKLAYDGSLLHGNITHWQPLPTPPKEK